MTEQKIYDVIRHSYGGTRIYRARRLNDVVKKKYREWYQKLGFVPVDEGISLEHINWRELPERESDGLLGDSAAWIITEKERDAYIEINNMRNAEKTAAEKANKIEELKTIIAECEKQTKLPTALEAKRLMREYNDINNEGGFGFIPHVYSVEEYKWAKNELDRLNAESVQNSVSPPLAKERS